YAVCARPCQLRIFDHCHAHGRDAVECHPFSDRYALAGLTLEDGPRRQALFYAPNSFVDGALAQRSRAYRAKDSEELNDRSTVMPRMFGHDVWTTPDKIRWHLPIQRAATELPAPRMHENPPTRDYTRHPW